MILTFFKDRIIQIVIYPVLRDRLMVIRSVVCFVDYKRAGGIMKVKQLSRGINELIKTYDWKFEKEMKYEMEYVGSKYRWNVFTCR